MTEMRKLKVLVLEDYIDAVLRTLIETGTIQLIDMRERLDSWEGTLMTYGVPVEVTDRCSNLLSRISTSLSKIDKLLEPLDGETSEVKSQKILISREKSEEVLTEVEQRLTELDIKLSSIEERWANIKEHQTQIEEHWANIKERKTLIEKLKSLTEGQEKTFLEEKFPNLEDQLESFKGELLKSKITTDLDKQTVEMEELISTLKPMLGYIREDLLTMEETIQREEFLVDAKSHFMRTAKTVYFEAFIPRPHIDDVMDKLKEVSEGNCLITDEPPSHEDKVPTAQKLAPSFMIAFEKLTTASGYPTVSEINPIPLMAITFPILFGIMFADVGQGAIFIILGAIATFIRRKVKLEEIGDITRYFFVSGELFIFIGISAIFFGFIFGEFFGPSGVLHPISLGKFGPFYIGGFEPTQEPMKMLKFAILVGVLHLSLGIIMRAINEVKKRHFKLIPIPICWLWLLIGGVYMWAYWGGISNISMWFSEGMLMLVGLIILPLVLIIVFTGIAESYMEGIGFGVEVFAETLSHTLSYGRLMALSLVHSVMNNLFLVLGGVEHGHFPITSIPLIAIGTILVMTVEGLIVFVHTLRLHWIEWFSKFYSGEGIPFKPLTRLDTNHRGMKRE